MWETDTQTRIITVCICTWTWYTFTRMDSLVLPMLPWRREIKPGSRWDPNQTPPYFQYPSDQTKAARVNKHGLYDFLRSIYPVQLGIGRDSKARKFQKAPYEEPSLWYNFLSFFASPCNSLITPSKQPSKPQLPLYLARRKSVHLYYDKQHTKYLPSLPHDWEGRRSEPANSSVQLVPE